MKDRERWMRLCSQDAIEQDLETFLQIEEEIIDLLKEKEERLWELENKPRPN